MTKDFNILIKKAKLKLFTNVLIFFGMCANKFSWEVRYLDKDIEGFIRFDKDDLNKIESGKIIINEKFLSQPDYTYNNLAFLICHELLHFLNKHGLRCNNRKWEEWNVACDHVIEVFLRKLSNVIKPYQNRYNIIDELYQTHPNCTAEFAYEWILKNPSKVKVCNSKDMTIKVQNGLGQHLFTVSDSLTDTNKIDNSAENMIINQFISEARALFENIKSQGNLPGYLVSYLDNILKVEIPWETLVEKSIKTNVILKPDERSWRSLNKFFIPHKINLPGNSLIEDCEGTGTLIIGLDSSGSISKNELKRFSHVVETSMIYFKTIELLVHDTVIHQQKTFDKDTIGDFYKFISEEGYRGRGGTSHLCLFTKIQDEYWEKDKDDLSMVISLTDAYSDIKIYYKDPKFEWIKNNIPLVFIITKNGNTLELDQSYGNITQIRINN